MASLFQSESARIGKHWWRILVRQGHGGRHTEYQFRRAEPNDGLSQWRGQRDWPAYNTNDPYCGLPRTLSKLHKANEQEIRAALDEAHPGFFFDGVFCGHPVSTACYAEPVSDGRWHVRLVKAGVSQRLGEVMGGNRVYLSMTMKGDIRSRHASLPEAARALLPLS